MLGPFRLLPFFSPRPWGSLDLAPWYPEAPPERIGEAWLTGEQCRVASGEFAGRSLGELAAAEPEDLLGAGAEAGGGFPLLVKLLFPRDKLSVQVHPDDRMAAAAGQARGKTECWYVLSAAPEAAVALGLRPGVSLDSIRAAVANRKLEDLLRWIPLAVGDMIYVDAGTVHAIGPGAVLLETQQSSDITYRLYDYGRPRELHLEEALNALRLQTEAGKVSPIHCEGYDELIRKRYFIVERHDLRAGERRRLKNETATAHSWVGLAGAATIEAGDAEPVSLERGHAVVVPAACVEYSVSANDAPCSAVRAAPPGRRM